MEAYALACEIIADMYEYAKTPEDIRKANLAWLELEKDAQ
jgi:hypothetical protein